MTFHIRIVRDKTEGRLTYKHGAVNVDTTCWWDSQKVIDDGTYTAYATRMASKTDGFDGGKREAIWLGKGVGLNGRTSNDIFIHKGTGPSWSDGCIVADSSQVLKIWQSISPKEQPNVSVEVLSVAGAKAQIRARINKEHDVVERSTWGASGPWQKLVENWDYDSIVIHHSGNWGEKDPKAIELKHKKKSFQDVGYHYLIHPNGTVYEGREILYKGEHVAGANTKKIGILMMGDYDEQWWDDDDVLKASQVAKLTSLVRTLQRVFPLTKLGGHKEYLPGKGYTCPGNVLMDKMDGLRKKFNLAAP